jgi:hypothetical protein
MGIFSALSGTSNPANNPKPVPAKRAAKAARRGGNAIIATTSAPRPGRTARVRSGGR